MVSIKKVLILFTFVMAIFGIFSTANASLDDLLSSVNVINDKARPGESLEYNVTLKNNGDDALDLSFNILFTGISELDPNVLALGPQEEKIVHVSLTIKAEQKPGNVLMKLLVFDDIGGQKEIFLQGEVLESPQPFVAVQVRTISFEPVPLDPRAAFKINFEVYNPIKTTLVPIEITSDILGFETVYYNDLYKLEEGTHTITIENLELPSDVSPGNHTFNVRLIFSDAVVSKGIGIAEVIPYSTCNITESEKVSIFGKSYSATISNIGTESASCTISTQISGIEKALITKVTEGYTIQEDEITWKIELQPQREIVVGYDSNYLPILLIPFIVIFLVVAVWYLTRKVVVRKELVDHKRYPGFMDLKLQLKITNLSKSEIKHINIYEPLPVFIKEIKEFGTMQGKLITRNKEKVIHWEIEKLNPKEERVLSYKVRTSVEVLGKMIFKPATIEFKDEKGSKKEEASNVLAIEVE